jgi:peptide/nickel transport system substrate-binding protein
MKQIFVVAAALLLSGVLPGAVAAPFVWPAKWTSSTPSEAKNGGVARAGVLSDHKTLNPFTTAEGGNIPGQVSPDGFFKLDPNTLEYVPYMAESYTLSKDKLVWTVNIRKGMTWSDGQPMVADDWVTTFKIHTDEDVASNSYDSFFINDKPIQVSKIDNDTVRIKFPALDATAIEIISYPPQPSHVFAPVYAAKGAAGIKTMWTLSEKASSIVSSGAFKFSAYRPGERAVFDKNPSFGEWNKDSSGRGLPYLDGYIQTIMKDQNIWLAQFLSGQVDTFAPRNADDLAQIKRAIDGGGLKGTLRPNVSPTASSEWMVFNWNRKSDPFKQRLFRSTDFRRAMSHLANRAAMIDIALGGLGTPAYSSVYAVFKDWVSPNLKKYEFNLEAAKGLLAKIGFSKRNADGWLVDRSGKVLEFDLNTNAGNTVREQLAKIFTDEAKKIGVKVNFRPLDFNSLVQALLQAGEDRKFDAVLLGLGGGGVIFPFGNNSLPCSSNLHAYNKSGKCLEPFESQMDALYARGRQELDVQKRRTIGYQIQDAEAPNQPWLYLTSPNSHAAWNARLRGEYVSASINSLAGSRDLETSWIAQ